MLNVGTNDNKLNSSLYMVSFKCVVVALSLTTVHVKSLKNKMAKDKLTNMMKIINRWRENHSWNRKRSI